MTDKFHAELEALRMEICEYGEYAIGMLRDVLRAMDDNDAVRAGEVYLRKELLAQRHHLIEEQSLRILALYSPAAVDLRVVACIIRMNYSLFRIGRMAKDIAKLVKYSAEEPEGVPVSSLSQMGKIVVVMLEDTMKAYTLWDLEPIRDLSSRDDIVDAMRSSLFRENLTYMMENSRNIKRCIDYISISRHLERSGDHACLMAGHISFMVTGERVEIR
ncbi:MAG: phosphate signaling complex protein PhoU [Methanomicrobiales archaeon]|nr:phosphate signaling complex protein PhoU [Methanomicrobiales archaeon]